MNETRVEVKAGTYISPARENRFNPPTDNADDMITGVMNLDEGQVSQIMSPRSQLDAIDIKWEW